jgi:predicted nucleotide-binding protein with TIR-like domain
MDNTIRKNEICVIGLPRCDFVFSSTRTCFIAYGFKESTLEMTILQKLLEAKGVQPVEAGGNLVPGQNAYCAKICSKIITSQFCIVLLNNDENNGVEVPNANVNMEYGLMLGFNKYVIPFQRAEQSLPFNLAGLDTIKYTNQDFERRGGDAIEQAIIATQQQDVPKDSWDQILQMWFLNRNLILSHIDDAGEKHIYRMGQDLGFNLLHNFSGDRYVFFGRFTTLRPELILWRLYKMDEILNGRWSSLPNRRKSGLINTDQEKQLDLLFKSFKIMVVVTNVIDKSKVISELKAKPIKFDIEVFCVDDIRDELERLAQIGSKLK